jgi:hypothetical protein
MKTTVRLIILLLLGMAATSPADTTYVAIDLTTVSYPSVKGVEPSPFIIGKWPTLVPYGMITMTLNGATGGQMGNRLTVPLPAAKIPADILAANHFSLSGKRGVGPSPFIVFRDLTLQMIPVTYGFDGTPSAGTPVNFDLGLNTALYGNATCLMELPESEFTDDQARMFLGTELGYIIVLYQSPFGVEILVEDIFLATVPPMPILDLQPIPQYAYIAVGALVNNQVYGFHYFVPGKDGPSRLAPTFYLQDPRPKTFTGFDTFGAHDAQLSRPDTAAGMVIADGSNILSLAPVPASAKGVVILDADEDQVGAAVKSIVSGSLLMLRQDESAVLYDPAYATDSGASPCDVNITDDEPDVCGYVCGDANGDGNLNIGDAVFVINYVFRGGPAPAPVYAGDANCDGKVNVGDAVYMVNYIFRGGPAPCCP